MPPEERCWRTIAGTGKVYEKIPLAQQFQPHSHNRAYTTICRNVGLLDKIKRQQLVDLRAGSLNGKLLCRLTRNSWND